jgi:hypothetical protein
MKVAHAFAWRYSPTMSSTIPIVGGTYPYVNSGFGGDQISSTGASTWYH